MMVKLQDLLKTKNGIRILVEKEEYTEFLEWAKTNECLWDNGKIIKPYRNEYRSNIVAITKDLLIDHPMGWISNMVWDMNPGYRFSDLKKDIIFDVRIEQSLKREKQNEIDKTIADARKYLFEQRCKQNRKISALQLKYKYITDKLPKQFMVKYNDNEELLKLVFLLQEYGYENVHNVDFSLFDDKPYVLCVDNGDMEFWHSNITCCACAASAGKKFYEYKHFEEMMKRIFNVPM